MNFSGFISLFWMGFLIGLSGAMIPGPLFAFTIKESLGKGAKTGLIIAAGHLIAEISMIFLLLFGLIKLFSSRPFIGVIGLLGGIYLFFIAVDLLRKERYIISKTAEKTHKPLFGGISLTLFNPSFPLWWVTVGYNMLFDALNVGGVPGAVVVIMGHWSADFGWYGAVSYFMWKGKGLIISNKIYPVLRIVVAVFMFSFGAYFFIRGINYLS